MISVIKGGADLRIVRLLRQKSKLEKRRIGEYIFLSFFFIFFLVMAFSLLYPLFWVLMNSLKTNFEYRESSFALPEDWLFNNYVLAVQNIRVGKATFLTLVFNTVWMAVVNTVVNIGCSAIAAYAVSKYRFPGKTFIYSIVILIQVLPTFSSGPAMLKFLYDTGIANNPFLIWLTWAGGFDFAFIVLYGYFKSVSWSYAEAAMIDGASHFKIMYKIMFPQAVPAIASLMVLNLIGAWNNYQTPMLYMKSYPNLAYALYLLDQESVISLGRPVYFSAIVMSMVPVMLVFVFCQKMIMTNVTAGALKG